MLLAEEQVSTLPKVFLSVKKKEVPVASTLITSTPATPVYYSHVFLYGIVNKRAKC